MSGGNHVVVTGGTSGVGLAVAERFLDEGASVSVLDVDGVAVTMCTERFEGEDIVFLECDITDADEVGECFARASGMMGPVDSLINCAGLRRSMPVERTSAELFRQIVDINLTGAFITCTTALDHMADRLSIVNLGSASGVRAEKGRAAYGASKAGLAIFSQVMAGELATGGVRVNVVTHDPGSGTGDPDAGVVSAVVYLVSDDAQQINGQVIVVGDGLQWP